MFNSLTGRLSETTAYGVRIETSGVEWDLETSAQTIARLARSREAVRVYTYLHHREDVMRLYGFYSVPERALFLELIKVSGVGPKQALRILSGAGIERLPLILETGDVDALAALPGLGRKTAQKILVTLQGTLNLQDGVSGGVAGGEIVAALVDMGFDRKAAQSAAAAAEKAVDHDGVETDRREAEILRRAIITLSGGDVP